MVTLWRDARPERGRTCASRDSSVSMQIPVEISARWLQAKACDFAAKTATGSKGNHHDRAVTNITQAARAGRQQLCQHVAGDRLGALAIPGVAARRGLWPT